MLISHIHIPHFMGKETKALRSKEMDLSSLKPTGATLTVSKGICLGLAGSASAMAAGGPTSTSQEPASEQPAPGEPWALSPGWRGWNFISDDLLDTVSSPPGSSLTFPSLWSDPGAQPLWAKKSLSGSGMTLWCCFVFQMFKFILERSL